AIGGSFLASTYAGAPWSGARLNITFTDGGGAHTQVLDLSSGSGYIGFVSSTPLQSLDVSLYDSNLTTFPTVQALSLGYAAAAVPEPARPALLLAGLVGLALLKRRAARG
ncbi:PEP-CTERM sorting domain-containing protein, partial [Salinisphaera sp. USBA-960]|nr:PEP-CTERM sorting domain-containing protein [Salifodinibacter halophilus]